MRASRFLKQAATEAKVPHVRERQTVARERQTVADPFLYHTKPPSAFWDTFRKRLVVNPESSSGMPLNEVIRSPPPASVTTVQVTPASKASDPAENHYHERDFRRMYPRLEMVTQSDLANILIAAPEQMKLPSPASKPSSGSVSPVANGSVGGTSLAALYASTGPPTSAAGFKPPTPPGKPHQYSRAEAPPHNENAYFPMSNYS